MKITTFSERLRQAMAYRNLKQTDIIERGMQYHSIYNTRIKSSDLSQYVHGKIVPKEDKLEILSKILGVNEVWLLGYDAPMIVSDSETPTYSSVFENGHNEVLERIAKRRDELGMTKNGLEDKLGNAKSALNKFENGQIDVLPTYVVETIAVALMTTPSYIIGWSNNHKQLNKSPISVGQRLKELRKKANYTQKQLAETLSTTQANVSGWELNKWQPDHEALKKLSNIFGVSIDYILCAENEHNFADDNSATTKQLVIGDILTEDEKEELSLLRVLSPSVRKSIREILRALT